MATITIIRPGYFRWIGENKCEATSNITLVQSGDFNILVDTGNASEAEETRSALKKHNLAPGDINVVVLTHHHPDHAGGLEQFSHATIYDWAAKINGDRYEFWKKEKLNLTPDVTLIKTPGHTPECVSLIANTERGRVACVGDLWWSGADDKILLAWNPAQLKESRELIREHSDFIIPGHDIEVPTREAA